jgi:hypothetical protein
MLHSVADVSLLLLKLKTAVEQRHLKGDHRTITENGQLRKEHEGSCLIW